jgi:MtN3 and saliva related transmembrane protein
MNMAMITEAIGMAAGALTTIAFLPQARRVLITRSTKDISLGMYIMFTTGVILWLIYGLLIGSVALIAANAVTGILAVTILVLKLRHG